MAVTHDISTQALHVFCAFSQKIPSEFSKAFPNSMHIDLSDTIDVSVNPVVVWLQLSSDSTVAFQVANLRNKFGLTALIVMSDIPNDLEALAAFSVSARGYCNTHAGAEVLVNIASVVEQGGVWIGESLMQRLLQLPAAPVKANSVDPEFWATGLSVREREVAKAVAAGASNKEVALKLAITERTVKAHVGAVLEKLHLKSRLQLALFVKDR